MVIWVLVLFGFTCHTSAVVRTGFATKWTRFTNTVITDNTVAITRNAGSASQCVILCLQQKNCVSVFYRQVSRRCQFHDVLFLSPMDGKNEMGTEYYSLTSSSCPLGYIHARTLGLCYQVHLFKTHRDKAVADCASRGEHFIVIDNQQKQDHVRKQITSSSESASKSFFIDGSDAETEGKWVYHDGRPVEFFAWRDSYPKNDTTQKDYLVAKQLNGAFRWMDRATWTPRRYMCQKDI